MSSVGIDKHDCALCERYAATARERLACLNALCSVTYESLGGSMTSEDHYRYIVNASKRFGYAFDAYAMAREACEVLHTTKAADKGIKTHACTD